MPEVFPWPKFSEWEQCKRVVPHALECLCWQNSKMFISREMMYVCRTTARYFMEHAQYKEAEPALQQARYISEQQQAAFPESTPDPSLLHDLASLYERQGHHEKAEPLFLQALEIYEKTFQLLLGIDPNEPLPLALRSGMTDSLNNLAGLYYNQERYTDAEPLYKRSLHISKQIQKTDHPDIAQSIKNLAEVYRSQQRYADAEPLFQQALAIRKQVLGPDHPEVALTLNGLATLYMDQKKYEQAESFYQRALSISEQAYPSGHTDVATIQNNLAYLYEKMGKKEKAEELYLHALKILELLLGSEHPNTMRTLNSLARLRKSMRKQGE